MENNFYVGTVCHNRKIMKDSYNEKVVLYSNDNINYTDLVNDVNYTTDDTCKDYVIKESIALTDISEYRTDYLYLLLKHNNSKSVKRKRFNFFDLIKN